MYNFRQQSYPDQACSVPMTYAYSSSQRYQRLQRSWYGLGGGDDDPNGTDAADQKQELDDGQPSGPKTASTTAPSGDGEKGSVATNNMFWTVARKCLLIVELLAFLVIGVFSIVFWIHKGSLIQPMHYATDLVPSTVKGAVSIFVVEEDPNPWDETDTPLTERHLYSVPYGDHTRVLGGAHNMWFWLLHTSLLTCSFIVLELFMPMKRWHRKDILELLKNPMSYRKMPDEETKESSNENKWSRSIAFVLFWNLGLGWFGAGFLVTVIPQCYVPINSFFLVTVMYFSWTWCILWFYSKDESVKTMYESLKKRLHLDKVRGPWTSRNAEVCVATCTSSRTGSARVFGSAIRRPAYLMKAELQTDRHGQDAWKAEFNEQRPGEKETRVFDALSFKFIEYTITAGIFLIGTIMVMGGNLQDVYVVQEALWGMALCNAIGVVLVQEVCREVVRAANDQDKGSNSALGFTGLFRSNFFWRTTGLFFASCACFLAAFLPLMLQNLIPVAYSYPVPPMPEQIRWVAHTLMIIYWAFAALGWVVLWFMPCLYYAFCRNKFNSIFAKYCTGAAQWGIVLFSLLNLIGKSLIAGFTLAGVWAMTTPPA